MADQLADASEAGDRNRVGELVRAHWPDLLLSGRWSSLNDAVRALPAEALTHHLGMYAEWIHLLPAGTTTFDLPDSDAQLTSLGQGNDAVDVLRDVLLAIVAARMRGRHSAALRFVVAGEAILRGTGEREVDGLSRLKPFWYLQAGIAAHLAGETDRAEQLLLTAWQLRGGDPYDNLVGVDAAGGMASILALRGDVESAEMWIERASGPGGPSDWLSEVIPTARRCAAAIVATDRLDEAEARAELGRIRPFTTLDERWPFTLWSRVHLGLVFEHAMDVTEIVAEAVTAQRELIGNSGAAADIVRKIEVDLALAMGHVIRARDLMEAAPGVPMMESQVRLRLLAGDPSGAEAVATAALTDHATTHRARLELLLLRANAHHSMGHRAAAARDIGEVLAICPPGVLRPFLTVPLTLLQALSSLVEGLDLVVSEIENRQLSAIYPAGVELVELTRRESSIVTSLSSGLTVAEIATQDFVALNTIKAQLRQLYRKVGVHSREELMIQIRDRGLLE